MGSVPQERSKLRRLHLWKKALLHFSLCFVMGFFTGFAPSSSSSWSPRLPASSSSAAAAAASHLAVNHRLSLLPTSASAVSDDTVAAAAGGGAGEEEVVDMDDLPEANPRRLLIVVTTTRARDRRRRAELLRLAHTLRLVRPPVLWVVVEPAAEAADTAEMLRGTGIMYRHLAFRPEENLTSAAAEAHAQRNAALALVEKHRLAGIVHFADAAGMYDLQFFEEIRQIEAFGTWPVATMSAGKREVVVEGPLCSASKVVGWFSRDLSDGTTRAVTYKTEADPNPAGAGATTARAHTIAVSGFAFNSSILWDPERWGRPTSLPDTSQDSIKFVQEVVLEDRAKLKGIPSDCSQIMMWQYNMMPSAPSTLQSTPPTHNRRR